VLNSFSIKNFRLFRAIEVKRLSRVNLIVGKNNSGKSAFLEAVQVYASNASPSVILGLVESRQETWGSEAQSQHRNLSGNSVRHLFFDHSLPNVDGEGIFLGELSSSSKLRLAIAAFRSERGDDGTISRVRVTGLSTKGDLTDIEISLVAEESERTRRVLNLDTDIRDLRRRLGPGYLERLAVEPRCPWQVVPTGNMANRKVSALWDLTSLTDLESEVISALRMIEPRVEGIALVEDLYGRSRGDERIPLVRMAGAKEPLPLKSMGDGLTRLFHIIVALVNAQNGILLIDEFENGLHWSIQPLVWDTVFRVAERLNVQVFATTHSRDCIQGFEQAWSKHLDLGAFFRLDLKDEMVRVREYTAETLTDALEAKVEVR
jgi:predicted ATPase